jgi:alpha-amylase/alpha-mannosidase (GH57 family)
MKKYVIIHGHFYQPPRENPWIDTIEKQGSAAPYHDWNERVYDECYRPNALPRGK